MLDELDDGARIGVWTALGVVALLLFGLLGGLSIQRLHAHRSPAPAVAGPGLKAPKPVAAPMTAEVAAVAASAAALAPPLDALQDLPLSGDLAGTIYFATGAATLPADAATAIGVIKGIVERAAGQRVVISGFHDATGDPARNAELAKERAKAVREALKTAGVDASRIVLRKPESTTGDGNNQEARRVEVRLVP